MFNGVQPYRMSWLGVVKPRGRSRLSMQSSAAKCAQPRPQAEKE